MSRLFPVVIIAALFGCGSSGAESHRAIAQIHASSRVDSIPPKPKPPTFPHVTKPSPLRGLYVNRWAAIGEKMPRLIRVAKRTEINALVIDVKDDRGFVLYRSAVPLAREIGADTNHTMSASRVRALCVYDG